MEPRQFADHYLLANKDNLPLAKTHLVRDKLMALPEDRQAIVQSLDFKNPMIVLILSLFLGAFGVDRFYIGDIGLGILKIISVFLIFSIIWVIVDYFLTYKKAKEINFNKLMLVL